MKQFLLAAALVVTAQAQVDPRALVRQSIENYDHDWREAMDWSYTQTDVMHSERGEEIEVSKIVPLDGTPYQRLISKHGQSLPPEEQRKEDHKFQKAGKQREDETPNERERRIRKYESGRAFIKEIPDAYNFTLLGEEPVDGRPAWVIQLAPRPGFVPSGEHAAMLSHIDGKLWIDKEDLQWAKAEAHVIDTIGVGWILARIGPGAHITLAQVRVAPGFWMPKELRIEGTARVLLVHNKNLDEVLTYSNFQREPYKSARILGSK